MPTTATVNRKAIPTEYQGVRFKSKSEAIFAHNLTMSGCFWEYEPDEFATEDGWIPDFLIARRTKIASDQKLRVSLALIEYKPSEPTSAYLDSIRKRLLDFDFGDFPIPFFVAYGNSFEPHIERGIWWIETLQSPWLNAIHSEKPDIGCHTFLLSHLDEAADYRFDLKH